MRDGLGVTLVAAVLGMSPAAAQKSADTLRLPYGDPIATASVYYDAKNETTMTSLAAFDTLACFDRKKGEYLPLLASSWTQVDDRIIEFKLRQDIVFQDGTPLTADDVVFTLNWIVDPASKLRFSGINFGWMARAEKVDTYTVRVVAKSPTPLAMLRLANNGEILPARLARQSADMAEFLRKRPIGTGPYKIVSIDAAEGIVLVRNPDYRHGNPCKPAASIGKVRVTPIPDPQTQLAQLATGGIDYISVRSKDVADMLAGNPDLVVTATDAVSLHHFALDAIGRSGVPALSDIRVRRAFVQALDRELIGQSVLPGGTAIHAADALCIREQLGCDYSVKPPAYDPAAAKRLLAEAGYPDGFDVSLLAMPGSWETADAMAGELRKVGIRASVEKATQGTMRERQAQGKMNVLVGLWPTASNLDASTIVSYYFDDTPRNYWQDRTVAELAEKGLVTTDIAQRKAVYRQLFDRANQEAFVLPLVAAPAVVVHSKDLIIDPAPLHAMGTAFYDMRWK
jgi:peptide/nickel transport system substrate-binding protein